LVRIPRALDILVAVLESGPNRCRLKALEIVTRICADFEPTVAERFLAPPLIRAYGDFVALGTMAGLRMVVKVVACLLASVEAVPGALETAVGHLELEFIGVLEAALEELEVDDELVLAGVAFLRSSFGLRDEERHQ
jgi:hypothetical protein